jgi:hypothetical protein
MSVAMNTKQHSITNVAHTLTDFGFDADELIRMELATIYTKADLLITYDGINLPVTSPEFGIYLTSGVIYNLLGHKNLDNLEMVRGGATDSLVTVVLSYGKLFE